MEKQAIKADGFSKLAYQMQVDDLPTFGRHWIMSLPQWKEMRQDLWQMLFQRKPELHELEKIEPQYRFSALVCAAMNQLREYRDIHAVTAGDDVKATEATMLLAEKASKWVDELKDRMKRMKKPKGAGSGAGGPMIPLPWGIEGDADETGDLMRQIIRDDLRQAGKELDEIESCVGAAGVTGKDGGELNAEERLKLGRSLRDSAAMKMLAEYVGRLERASKAIRQSTIDPGVSEVTDIEVGADIPRFLSSELLGLAEGDEAELAFFRKFTERQVLQYKLRSVEPLDKGPMVVCFDVSPSMMGHREMWAKAVALALATVCREQKRNLHVIAFESHIRREWSMPGGVVSLEQFTSIAQFGTSGGTDFEPPLRKAVKVISEDTKFQKADIVFITDGEAVLNNGFVRWFEEQRQALHFRLWAVAIDCGNAPTLDKIADDLALVQGTNDREALNMIFGRATIAAKA